MELIPKYTKRSAQAKSTLLSRLALYGHAEPWKRLGSAVTELATLYDGAQFFWAMPDYVGERLRSVADLATPELSRDIRD